MKRRSFRAGAIASVAMLLAALFSSETNGALAQESLGQVSIAQNRIEPLLLESAEIQTASPDDAVVAAQRFTASEMVQPLPDHAQADQMQDDTVPATPPARSLRQLVDALPVGGEMSDEMTCLAQAVYFESRGEPLDGQLAVARVVINRAESSLFPDDYCSVVTQRAQFSFVRNGRIPGADTRSLAWKRATAIARIAHQELWETQVDDALFFHATYVRPSWARTKLARATIDSHIFYR